MVQNSLLSRIETPSGKDPSYENFPVGSFLLQRRFKPHIITFYRFARAIDDIADTNTIKATEKIERLSGFENVILGKDTQSEGYEKAQLMRLSLQQTGVTHQHCIELIRAFKQDATKLRYETWKELIAYCQMSAAPVGRYLLDLHGESNKFYEASDALCNALQVLNHLQDCKDDYATLNRVYLPQDWMKTNGLTVNCFRASHSMPEFQSLKLQILDSTALLLGLAENLPRVLKSRRLAMETGAILKIALQLEKKLRSSDPLAEAVNLSKFEYIFCFLLGAFKALFNR